MDVRIDEIAAALGTAVRSVHSTLIGEFSCEIWRLDVRLGNGQVLPVALKRPLPTPGRNSLALERRFYERCATLLDAVPRYLGALPRHDGILLEYIDDVLPFDWRNGPSDAHATAAIAALAQLHRLRLDDTDWLPRFDAVRIETIQNDYAQAWHVRRDGLAALHPAFASLGDRLANELAVALAPLAEHAVLLHGDAHTENLAVRAGGGVVMFDWQDPALGNPGSDVADLLVMSYPTERRRAVAAATIDRHARLLGRQAGYDPDAGYRAGVLHRVARIVCIAHRHPNWPSLPWVFERCAAAALDVVAAGGV